MSEPDFNYLCTSEQMQRPNSPWVTVNVVASFTCLLRESPAYNHRSIPTSMQSPCSCAHFEVLNAGVDLILEEHWPIKVVEVYDVRIKKSGHTQTFNSNDVHFVDHHATIIAAKGSLGTPYIPRQHSSTSVIDIHQYWTRQRPSLVIVVAAKKLQLFDDVHRWIITKQPPPPLFISGQGYITDRPSLSSLPSLPPRLRV